MILGGYLIANVGGPRNKTSYKNADENIENTSTKTKKDEVVTSKEKGKFDESSLNGINTVEVSGVLKSKVLKDLSSSEADDLFAELAANPALKKAMEADEILPGVWKRINDGIPIFKSDKPRDYLILHEKIKYL